jgi:hypothetical protein
MDWNCGSVVEWSKREDQSSNPSSIKKKKKVQVIHENPFFGTQLFLNGICISSKST